MDIQDKPIGFQIIDYVMAVAMCVGTLLVVDNVIDTRWNMFFAMLGGMILGLPVLMIMFMIFSPVSSPFEIFPSGMLITMTTGMITGMFASTNDHDLKTLVIIVISISIFIQICIDLYNKKLRGELPLDKQD